MSNVKTHSMTNTTSKYFRGNREDVSLNSDEISLFIDDIHNALVFWTNEEIASKVLEQTIYEVGDRPCLSSSFIRHSIGLLVEELNS